MTAPRALQLQTEQQAIDEIARLRRGCRQTGNWTLAQVCWHVCLPIDKHLHPPEPMDLAPTPEQATIKARFVDHIIANGQPPPFAKDAPPGFIPPATANDADIDRYVAALQRMQAYPHPKVMMGPVGPVTTAEFRTCNLVHAAHHLAFLVPTPARRTGLAFADEDAVIADIRALRAGYAKGGSWSLGQICWHLDAATKARMQPGPFAAETSEQTARRATVVPQVLASGQLPTGINAPEQMTPPADAGDAAIDSCIATLSRFKTFPGPIAPHRLFGHIPDPDARRLSLIHCAHHLSYLVPNA